MTPPPRSYRRWPSSCLDKIPVRLPEVELVRLDFLWQHAEALFKSSNCMARSDDSL